jgi:hypothetical protein
MTPLLIATAREQAQSMAWEAFLADVQLTWVAA